jgi:serine/threonine-protein kinase
VTTTCKHCATPVPDDAVYCHQCGSLVSDAEGQAAITASMDDSAIRHLTDLLCEDTEGEFEIIRQLGRGGMAVVFLAKEIELQRQVAIKALPPELTFGHGVERFKREARTAAGLDHANIIPIYRIAGGGRIFWYAMKYLEGRSLDHVLRDVKSMSLEETIELLLPVADALDYAHEQSVIHRDIKPANVMVDSRNRVVVTDFGIAKALTESTLTASGSVIGTPYYMSPEQGQGQQVSGASDQYSVAVIAYRMLSGQLPFEGGSAIDILHKHCTMLPPPLDVLRPNLPEYVYRAVKKALAKKPAGRFSSVTAFVKGLEGASDEITNADVETLPEEATPPDIDRISTELIVTPPPTDGTRERPSPEPTTGGRRLLYALALVFVVGAVAVGAWQVGRRGAQTTTSDEPAPAEATHTDSLHAGPVQPETTATPSPAPRLSRLMVTGAPAGAVVSIDGQRQNGPDLELPPGVYSLRIEAAGNEAVSEQVTLVAGDTLWFAYVAVPSVVLTAPVTPQPTPESRTQPAPRAPGTLQIGVRPVAAVLFVDGERRESGRRHVVTLTPGEHVLRFEADGYVAKDTVVLVVSGDTITVPIELTRIQQ